MKALTPVVLALSVFCLLAGGQQASAQELKELNRENPLVLAIRKVKPSVLFIKVERDGNWGRTRESLGTGFIIDERGYAVTNRHVVASALKIKVCLADKSELTAEVVVEDANNDLAVLKLPAGRKYQPLTFGPGSDLMVGETVIAIGNPCGYVNTVTTGIISALGREIQMPGDVHLTNLIQHSACINPGNSGGPLVNINGELIGINVALRDGAQAIEFAINSDTASRALAQDLSAVRMAKVHHGLTCSEVVQFHGWARQQVRIEKVASNSPAAEAGLKQGDVIVKLGNRPISNGFDVERAFWDTKPGDRIEATVLRAGQPTTVALILDRDEAAAVSTRVADRR